MAGHILTLVNSSGTSGLHFCHASVARGSASWASCSSTLAMKKVWRKEINDTMIEGINAIRSHRPILVPGVGMPHLAAIRWLGETILLDVFLELLPFMGLSPSLVVPIM